MSKKKDKIQEQVVTDDIASAYPLGIPEGMKVYATEVQFLQPVLGGGTLIAASEADATKKLKEIYKGAEGFEITHIEELDEEGIIEIFGPDIPQSQTVH